MDVGLRFLNGALMLALPVALAALLVHRLDGRLRLLGVGAVTFIVAQIVHLPLLKGLTGLFRATGSPVGPEHTLLFNAIVLGLAAGVCEEGARWLGYRFLAADARRWEDALLLGAGHGGTEAMILGVLVIVGTVRTIASTVPPETETAVRLVAGLTWTVSTSLLGAIERLFALCNHLAMSVLVLQAFVRRAWIWLLAAIGWHAVLDGTAVYFAPKLSALALEGVLGVFALAALAVVFALKPRAPAPAVTQGGT
jgi:uncharacterized membrane protein YhfC